jgi:aromatic ring hydroxylase
LMHQRAVKYAVATELRLGLVLKVARAAIESPLVLQRVTEILIEAQLLRLCLQAAENGAQRDRWGQFFPSRPALAAATSFAAQPQ